MKLTKDPRQSLKKYINSSTFRFVISGGLNTVLTYLLYLALLSLAGYGASYTASYLVGILIGYFLNSIFVFQVKPNLKSGLLYPGVYLAQYIIGMGILVFLIETADINKRIAPLVVVALTLPAMFILTRYFFKKTSK